MPDDGLKLEGFLNGLPPDEAADLRLVAAAMLDREEVAWSLTVVDAYMVASLIQFAVRCAPDSATAQYGRRVVERLVAVLDERHPGVGVVFAKGWNPDNDT